MRTLLLLCTLFWIGVGTVVFKMMPEKNPMTGMISTESTATQSDVISSADLSSTDAENSEAE